MLDAQTQNVSIAPYCGKLGFAQRHEQALPIAANTVAETLSDFGYDVDHFETKQNHRLKLECDHYVVELRHRRRPSPMRKVDGTACRSQLELLLTPRFLAQTDSEITELLLARCMQNLLMVMDVETVEWLDTAVRIPAETFLQAFEPHAQDTLHVAQNAQHDKPEPVVKRASPFAPVDETLGVLSNTCALQIERRPAHNRPARPGPSDQQIKNAFRAHGPVKSALSRICTASLSFMNRTGPLSLR